MIQKTWTTLEDFDLDFDTRAVDIDGYTCKIAPLSLESLILSDDTPSGYTSDLAEHLDTEIYSYVDDETFYSLDDDTFQKYVDEHVDH